MRGHIRQRGSKWAVVVDLGRDPITKKRQQRWESFPTKKEAEKRLSALLTAVDKGERVEKPTRITFGSFLIDTWLPHLEARVTAGNLRALTLDFYGQLVTCHIVPGIGHLPLRSLTTQHLEAFYAELSRSGNRKARGEGPVGLGPGIVRSTAVTVSTSLKYAVKLGLLAHNPATDVETVPPKNRAQPPIWTPEQMATFLASAQHERLYPLFLLAATTGLRRSELAGLTWDRVDFQAGTVTVAQARTVLRGRAVTGQPKTDKSARVVSVDPGVMGALRAFRRRQFEEHLAWGPAYADSGLVAVWEDGRPLPPERLLRTFQRLAARAGLPQVTFHSIRHLHATSGLHAGVKLETMSKRLGHSSIAITADIYAHAIKELDEEAAKLTAAPYLLQAAQS